MRQLHRVMQHRGARICAGDRGQVRGSRRAKSGGVCAPERSCAASIETATSAAARRSMCAQKLTAQNFAGGERGRGANMSMAKHTGVFQCMSADGRSWASIAERLSGHTEALCGPWGGCEDLGKGCGGPSCSATPSAPQVGDALSLQEYTSVDGGSSTALNIFDTCCRTRAWTAAGNAYKVKTMTGMAGDTRLCGRCRRSPPTPQPPRPPAQHTLAAHIPRRGSPRRPHHIATAVDRTHSSRRSRTLMAPCPP